MPDMIVKLYELDKEEKIVKELKQKGIDIRRAMAPEKYIVLDWVRQNFGDGWASECDIAFSNHPVTCVIAIEHEEIIGFACVEATCKDYFGPTGVFKASRGNNVGAGLLIAGMSILRDMGYAYAIIGGAGPTKFYEKIVNAEVIQGSVPGIYEGMLYV